MSASSTVPGPLDFPAAVSQGDGGMAGPPGTPMWFSGRAGEFFGMLVRGTLLLIPTFGFYRFWLVTRLRRHLWANTRIGDEGFEYLGTAKEILIGFLMALAILTPVYLGYFLVGIYLEEQKQFASVALVLFLWALSHFGMYRGRRYRTNRTAFRGVRFWMDGSGLAYMLRAIGWDLVTLLTLGFAFPWRAASLERYRMRHTHFGTIDGHFDERGGALMLKALPWAIAIIACYGTAVGLFIFLAQSAANNGAPTRQAIVAIGAGLLVLTALLFFCYCRIYKEFLSWRLSGLRLGSVTLRSNLKTRDVAKPAAACLFSVMALFAVLIATSLLLPFVLGGPSQGTLAFVTVVMSVLYFVVILGSAMLIKHFLVRGIWARLVGTAQILNVQAFENAARVGDPHGRGLDQGFADLLDAGGI